MNTHTRSRTRWLSAVLVLLLAAAIALAVLTHSTSNLGLFLLLIPFGGCGVLIAARQPQNAIGWILVAIAAGSALGTDASSYSESIHFHGAHALPLGRLAVALVPLGWMPFLALLPLPLLLFPAGRVPGGVWRWTFRAYLVVVAVWLVSEAVLDARAFTDHHPVLNASGGIAVVNGTQHGLEAAINSATTVAWVAIFVSWLVRLLIRYRTAQGDERQQLKWFFSGAGASLICLFVAATAPSGSAASALFLGVILLPVGIGIAVLKYRLYEIDRIISRTLAYAILTALLAGTFVGLVVLTTRVLPFSSEVGVAASTLAAAALFNPLRVRVQRRVDRRFNRARYDAEQTVAAFAQRLRDAVELDTIQSELLATVRQAVEPRQTSVWVIEAHHSTRSQTPG